MKQILSADRCSVGDALCRADDDNSRIRVVRLARGMQNRELAASMGVSPARISALERDERRGAVTLKMMKKAADALGCEFIYTLARKSRQSPEHTQACQKPKPHIKLDSSQLGDTERQRLLLRQVYARKLSGSTQK